MIGQGEDQGAVFGKAHHDWIKLYPCIEATWASDPFYFL